MAASKPYRRGVGIVLLNARGKVFVAERIDTPGAWQMPQGGIDKNELPRAAALRELHEETGTDKARIIAATRTWLRYDLPADLQKKVWKGKYRGQEQKWFLMTFTGAESDIDIVTEHPEFSAWKWAKFEDVPKMIVGFKRDIYKQVVAAFKDKVARLKPARGAKPKKKTTRLKR
ncbi:MAG: RNA pyrophosphohydrolase [Rhodospirillaceae bacterium]